MAKDYLNDLYEKFAANFVSEISSNDFYSYFINMIESKPQEMTVYEKYVERTIDMKWVEALEEAVIPLDNIIRNPNRYIRRDEDVVRIELARDVGPEAVRHLAQHTNMIAKVENEEVTPERILNITKEEAFDTYENRFIYTLLRQVEYFVDRRLSVLNEKSKLSDRFEYKLEGTCEAGNDDLDYSFVMNFTTPHTEVADDELFTIDTAKLSALERVERIRKIIYTFRYTPFMKRLAGCTPVRPPLTMTNVLTKNQDFVKAVALWNFVSMYEEVGFSMDFVDRQVTPGDRALKELYSVVMIQYMLLKQYTHKQADIGSVDERRQKMAPNIIKRNIENIVNNYDLTINQVKRIFEDEIKKKETKRDAQFNKARSIIARAIEAEEALAKAEEQKIKEREERERKRLEAIRKAEEKRIERERKAAALAAEKERKAAERAEKERLAAEAREAARIERERIAAEKAAERERLAAERAEQARIKAEQKAAEIAAKAIERERLAAERAEKARLAAEAKEAARIERERLAAERAEKARLAAEAKEAARIERERLAAEKAEKMRIEAERKEAERIEREERRRQEEIRKAAEKAAAEAEAARKREEELREQARIAAELARQAEEARRKAEEARAEAERLAALYAPFKAEEERIEEGFEKAKTMSRKKKKATKRKLEQDLKTVEETMPDEVKKLSKNRKNNK